jgi:hypothetical protein
MRRLLAALAAGVLVSWAESASASPTARLIYARAPGAESCPDEDALRRAVAARVGYDPFFAWAPKTIVARMSPDEPHEAAKPDRAGGFVASVSLVDEQGTEHGERVLRTSGACADLLEVTALGIAIAIDPQRLLPRAALPEPPVPAPAPPPVAPHLSPPAFASTNATAVPPSAPPPAQPPVMSFEASAGAVASAGVAPLPAAGIALGLGVWAPRWSLAAEGRVDAPASEPVTGQGRVSSSMLLGALVPCVHTALVFACALGQVGTMRASSEDVTNMRSQSLLWLAAGGRFGVQLPIERHVFLRLRTDLVADLAPPRFRVNAATAWTAPWLAASLGGDVVAHF